MYEEKQTSHREENNDSNIYFNTLQKWRDIIEWIYELKITDDPPVSCIKY